MEVIRRLMRFEDFVVLASGYMLSIYTQYVRSRYCIPWNMSDKPQAVHSYPIWIVHQCLACLHVTRYGLHE